MAEKNFNEMLGGLFKGLNGYVDAKTVVGDPISLPNNVTLIPLVDVSFGVGGGAFNKEVKNKAYGGLGGKLSANSVIIIQNDNIRLLNIKEQDALTKCVDLIPEIIKKIKNIVNGDTLDEIVDACAREAADKKVEEGIK
ncbi:MAG: GerW family sporulation protein [Clostridiales bacterium]|nr:GerW family sporulation protein [Clostridiales bacterium]